MELYQAVILGVVQGLTEFIPVSSSGHLTILPYILNWTTPSITFDIAVHFGTLLALVIYFRQRLLGIVRDVTAKRNLRDENTQLWIKIAIATIPAALIGFAGSKFIENFYKSDDLRSPALLTAAAMTIFGILFVISDRIFANLPAGKLKSLPHYKAFIIGLGQAFALFRGVSRSGATIFVARFAGLRLVDAAEFSFLMSIPIMLLTTVYGIYQLLTGQVDLSNELEPALAGAVSALISGLIAINYMMSYLRSKGLSIFGWYRIIFATFVILLIIT